MQSEIIEMLENDVWQKNKIKWLQCFTIKANSEYLRQ